MINDKVTRKAMYLRIKRSNQKRNFDELKRDFSDLVCLRFLDKDKVFWI